jgi:hypothetical protein
MLNDVWIDIFRRIPVEQHNQLMVVTKAGVEVSVETVFRLEPAYLAMRGRPAGSTDSGRLFFIPYAELNYIYLNRIVQEEEVRAIFGDAPPAPAPTLAARLAEQAEPMPAVTEPVAVAAPVPTLAAPPSSVTPLPGRPPADAAAAAKNNLLERIRAARNSAVVPRSTS